MIRLAYGIIMVATVTVGCGLNASPAKAAGCIGVVTTHASGYVPNCDIHDPQNIHRAGSRYCAVKTEVGRDGKVFCPPNNRWISKAEAYRLIGK